MRRKAAIFFRALIGLAVCFCLFGCGREPVETDFLLPVDFSNIPENMVLTDFHADKIEIRIQAPPQFVEHMNKEGLRYPVDLYTDLEFDPAGDSRSIEPGEYLIPVDRKRIPVHPAMRILNIKPSYLIVKLEKKIKRIFRITIPYTGAPAQGYKALPAEADPPVVELTGPASLIETILELKTKPIDLANVNEGFKKKIPLDLEDPSITSVPDLLITVTVPVEQQLVSKTIENLPVHVWNASAPVLIDPPAITIQVKGPYEKISNKDVLGRIYAFMDVKGLPPGVYARNVLIHIPVDLIMTDAAPRIFTIKIK